MTNCSTAGARAIAVVEVAFGPFDLAPPLVAARPLSRAALTSEERNELIGPCFMVHVHCEVELRSNAPAGRTSHFLDLFPDVLQF